MSLKGSNEAGAQEEAEPQMDLLRRGIKWINTWTWRRWGFKRIPPSDGTISVDCGVSRGVSSVSGKSPKGSSGFGSVWGGVASEEQGEWHQKKQFRKTLRH